MFITLSVCSLPWATTMALALPEQSSFGSRWYVLAVVGLAVFKSSATNVQQRKMNHELSGTKAKIQPLFEDVGIRTLPNANKKIF